MSVSNQDLVFREFQNNTASAYRVGYLSKILSLEPAEVSELCRKLHHDNQILYLGAGGERHSGTYAHPNFHRASEG